MQETLIIKKRGRERERERAISQRNKGSGCKVEPNTQCPLFINQETAKGDYFSSWAADRLSTDGRMDGQTPTTSDVLKNTCRAFRRISLLLAVSRRHGSTGLDPSGASFPPLDVFLFVFSSVRAFCYVSDFTALNVWTRGLDVNWEGFRLVDVKVCVSYLHFACVFLLDFYILLSSLTKTVFSLPSVLNGVWFQRIYVEVTTSERVCFVSNPFSCSAYHCLLTLWSPKDCERPRILNITRRNPKYDFVCSLPWIEVNLSFMRKVTRCTLVMLFYF